MKLIAFSITAFVVASFVAAPLARAEGSQVSDPGAFGIVIDPNASGTKVSGNVSFIWDFEQVDHTVCNSLLRVVNMSAVATMQKGNQILPFFADYNSLGDSNLKACFEDQTKQVQFLQDVIQQVIIPGFYGCSGNSCPGFAIKSIKNFLGTVATPPSQGSSQQAGSMDLELAVR